MTAYWKANPDLSPHVPGLKRVALARLMLDGQPYGLLMPSTPPKTNSTWRRNCCPP